MKEAIGSIPLYNIIIVFIVITFGFLAATLSYYKAFKVNSKIATSIEKFEGYNKLAEEDISETLSGLGYTKDTSITCPSKSIGDVVTNNTGYAICIYQPKTIKNGSYFNYGIVTFIYLDIPLIGKTLKIPVYSETERIYKFSS
jgi:hypothetical protein